MPSNALLQWRDERSRSLDEFEMAHRGIGGSKRGRRYTTQQINRAYAVLVSAHFQGFCRELHSECINALTQTVPSGLVKASFQKALLYGRKLDRGNPNPGNIGEDFNRFEFLFWDTVYKLDHRNKGYRNLLENLNQWRNAIAHQDFNPLILGATILRLSIVRAWRRACDQLATAFDETMKSQLTAMTNNVPW